MKYNTSFTITVLCASQSTRAMKIAKKFSKHFIFLAIYCDTFKKTKHEQERNHVLQR